MKRACWFALICGLIAPAARAQVSDADPIRPTKPIRIFNGRDLSGLYTWIADTKYDDPRQVFTVKDGQLCISGDGYGYVTTKDKYRDYHLVTEWKWGPRTWGKRADRTKDSGILVHCTGPDGNGGSWMSSIESQIIQGGVGDFILVQGKNAEGKDINVSLTCEVDKDRDGETIWKKGGERVRFDMNNRKRINWYGRDPDWEDKLGFRGKIDVEKPDGEWNRHDVICDDGRVATVLNGVLVNEGFNASPTSGQIIFQTEGAELIFRRIELYPIGEAPPYAEN